MALDEKTKKAVKEALEEIVDEVKEEVEAAGPRRPGQHTKHGKVPWSKKDLEAISPLVTFTPEEDMMIRWNGLTYYLKVDVDATVPHLIKQEYDAIRKYRRGLKVTITEDYGPVAPIGYGALEEIETAAGGSQVTS